MLSDNPDTKKRREGRSVGKSVASTDPPKHPQSAASDMMSRSSASVDDEGNLTHTVTVYSVTIRFSMCAYNIVPDHPNWFDERSLVLMIHGNNVGRSDKFYIMIATKWHDFEKRTIGGM